MSTAEQEKSIVEDIAVAEIEHYMGGIIEVESDNIPLIYLKELQNLYVQQIKYHGYALEYEHSMRFKEKILKHIPELTGRDVMGRDVILTLKDDCGNVIFEACDLQGDGMFLERAAVSISYKNILEIQNSISNQLCKLYDVQISVCPPKLQENIFTVPAIDNLDHNPSSNPSKDSFHGTGIIIFQ